MTIRIASVLRGKSQRNLVKNREERDDSTRLPFMVAKSTDNGLHRIGKSRKRELSLARTADGTRQDLSLKVERGLDAPRAATLGRREADWDRQGVCLYV